MKQTNYRLKSSVNHRFSGHQLVRDRRIRFTLNGQEFKAYQGDTILTALMAAGIFSAGQNNGSALALDAALELCVKRVDAPDEVGSALPIARTPALQGLALEIYGVPPIRLKSTFGGGNISSLKIDFDKFRCTPGPLHDAPLTTRHKINLLVVGGGIAGMTAAVAAAEAGKMVILIERRAYLGGDAELFGYADGEENPRDIVGALRQKISQLTKIKVFTHTEALDINDRKLTAHVVEIVDGQPSASLMRISARNIILATGAADKLPLFPGNRLPRIASLTEVFHLATAYGLWRGNQTAVFTNTNIAYRFSGQAQNADAQFVGIFDARTNRASRFIDIAKAGGQKVINGAQVHSVSQNQRSGQLSIMLEPSQDGLPALDAITADQLILNDGWQPRLNLWRLAGGKIDPSGAHVSDDIPANMMLAGSCAGLIGHMGVQQSAQAAVGRLMLKKEMDVSDPQIDVHFETPEGPETVSSSIEQPGDYPVYTSGESSLVTLSPMEKKGLFGGVFALGKSAEIGPITDRALSFVDTLVLTQRGVLPVDAFERLLEERAIAPHLFEAGETRFRRKFLADNIAVEVPVYVEQRFGADAQVWDYEIESGIPLQTGVPLFPNTDVSDPMKAIGIVVGEGKSALVKLDEAEKGAILVARVGAQTSTIKLGTRNTA